VQATCLQMMLFCAMALALLGNARAAGKPQQPASALKACASVIVDRNVLVTLGKTTIVQLEVPMARMVIGGRGVGRALEGVVKAAESGGKDAAPQASDGVADVDITLLSPTELFILGKTPGAMNVVLQSADGHCRVKDITVTIDQSALQAKLAELMPEETGIRVRAAENSIVLLGSVSDAVALDQVMTLVAAYGNGKQAINLMRINSPQQVMLEVKIAEVSKTVLEKLGLDFSRMASSADGLSSSFISGIIGGASALFRQSSTGGTPGTSNVSQSSSMLGIDAQKRDGLFRILAEPNIMAISGQSASFLSGGKIFIPVAQGSGVAQNIRLEEKEFGVGLKFTPTVLTGTRINLKLITEVSELAANGSAFTTVAGATSVLPTMTTRRVDTTVQLNDGQSFAVAGLIKRNFTEAIKRFPGVGELPIVGALFRSTEFQNDQTELIFVITPRLVKPMSEKVVLPTDNHIVPSRAEALFYGKAEGDSASSPASSDKH
jgi:pilus assembly protein CpaC